MSALPLAEPLPLAAVLEAAAPPAPVLGRTHSRRLREIYRSAGWPCQDLVEVELLAFGLVERVASAAGETLRVTDAGIAAIAQSLQRNRACLSQHEALVEAVARELQRAGRLAWRGLSLRAQVPCDPPPGAVPVEPLAEAPAEPAPPDLRWCIAKPDVFSIRNTTVEAYALPVVHEVKVRRADLLGDLRKPAKRAAYLNMASECWYVLGNDARGRPIAAANEIPLECGVMVLEGTRLCVARPAPRRAALVPFAVWMTLAKSTPVPWLDEGVQQMLGEGGEDGNSDEGGSLEAGCVAVPGL